MDEIDWILLTAKTQNLEEKKSVSILLSLIICNW